MDFELRPGWIVRCPAGRYRELHVESVKYRIDLDVGVRVGRNSRRPMRTIDRPRFDGVNTADLDLGM